MTEFSFSCLGVRPDPCAAAPTLVFRLRITASTGVRVHALALRCGLRIEPARRGYDAEEAAALGDLLGERSRWGGLDPVRIAQVSAMVPGFAGGIETDLAVPCTYDTDVVASRYFRSLNGGDVPLLLRFSGTAFTGAAGVAVEPVDWEEEISHAMPVKTWHEMIDQHFPGCGWLRLPGDAMDALLAYRTRNALPSWEATVERLLDGAGEGAH
ncbi:DUF6084 family protein [Streptomyces genisteinicus]|uniref:Uncharacterized protein n=1 Tax=Streptomyces genisteinicus TaxID=2768068 RepID=A0A7H0I219_9ACTN|nr:DUF6084 family protein [Streptomyces genisteinicus]QNP66835.1 hypothetical protein IAG43_30545 [Streptomyces genisteinicus]